jgi:hypothetical protein
MNNNSSFQILNTSEKAMRLVHEPEGFEFILEPKEEVVIEFDGVENGVALRYSTENAICIIGILPEKSLYRVFHNGFDVFKDYI